ncbi:lipoxygenase homology domain-containing protein 1-like [Plakobranchus ocellatus]|uniref:Lipoxygenase homology domain-containing protein 1-like n=1 Tax=Plakobranchus ocellatus TaxID=259542 RepID=A0AAV3YW46_9GAST|nr:lipoxygenase homology domain-containing protein 1-like [Plakobranchus ocellatus]
MAGLDQLRALLHREQGAMQQLQQHHVARGLAGRGGANILEGYNPQQLLFVNNHPPRPQPDLAHRYQVLLNYPHLRRIAHPPPAIRLAPFLNLIKMEEDVLSYSGESGDQPGLYIASHPIDHYDNYFEIQILDVGDLGQIAIGLVPEKYPLNVHPGIEPNSVGYMAENGKIYLNHGRGIRDTTQQGPACGMGDKIGVGIRPIDEHARPEKRGRRVFFTRNGQEVKAMDLSPRFGALYPAVGMQSEGEEVSLRLDAVWNPEDVTQMLVDCGEEDWLRLEDIRLNGNTLEYTGRGHSIQDVGLAQAKFPLDTTNHYFEFEIIDPGEKCFVAIGLARRNYPNRRHPGWNHGSIAYHADDGKLFHGSGMGMHFGPKCSLGDVMGCGIYFPLDYDDDAADNPDEEGEGDVGLADDDIDDDPINNLLWDSDDEENPLMLPMRRRHKEKGKKVKVFFKRNGKLIGLREVSVPQGGFFPTIGMTSCNEKVRVDLHPLSG